MAQGRQWEKAEPFLATSLLPERIQEQGFGEAIPPGGVFPCRGKSSSSGEEAGHYIAKIAV